MGQRQSAFKRIAPRRIRGEKARADSTRLVARSNLGRKQESNSLEQERVLGSRIVASKPLDRGNVDQFDAVHSNKIASGLFAA